MITALLVLALTAAPPDRLPSEPSREAELAAIRQQISWLEGRLARVRREETGVARQLAETELELGLQEQRLAEAVAAREAAAAAVVAVEAEIGRLEERREGLEGILRGGLVTLYRLGRAGYLRLLLSVGSRQGWLPGVRQVRYLARRNARALEDLASVAEELDRERSRLRERRREMEGWVERERSRRQELATLRGRYARRRQELEHQSQDLARRAAELAAKESKLASFLEFLAAGASAPLEGTSMARFRGVLDWPVRGRVVVGFGPRLDPRYGTRVPHNGIELEVTAGSAVRVVFPGRVRFAAPFQGYGQTVVVEHPGRVFSLYAGLATIGVAPDAMVSLGAELGRSSERLFFEITLENRPVDPADWLR